MNIVECEKSPCDENATCQDTIGSFDCQCNDGFDVDGITGFEINV